MLRRDTLKLALAAPVAAALHQGDVVQDLSPPPSWPKERIQDWYKLLDDALKPEAARRFTNRITHVHDSIQCGTGHRGRQDTTVAAALDAIERAAMLRGLVMPERFHERIARVRKSENPWRPSSPEYPLGAAVLFPVNFESTSFRTGEPYWHKDLQAWLRIRGRVWVKRDPGFYDTMETHRLPLTRTERGHIAHCPEGVEFDLEWSWRDTDLKGRVIPLSQVWSYNREGTMRLSAYRTADDKGWSRIVLNDPKPYCSVPEHPQLGESRLILDA